MRGSAMTCLAALLCVGCSEDPLELDAGWAFRAIAGVVTDSAGAPVPEVEVRGFHTDFLDSLCGYELPLGFDDGRTDENGKYSARISEIVWTTGAGTRCVFLDFLPPEGSGLGSVSIDSMVVHVYGTPDDVRADHAWLADTLSLNVTLPPAREDG